MNNPTKVIVTIAWLSVLFIALLFLTPMGELFVKGAPGHEGALGRLLNAAMISLLLSIISLMLGLRTFFSKAANKPKLLLFISVGPLISFIAFIMLLILYPW